MSPRIAVLCATRRGYLFLKTLIGLLPEAELVVFSFKEEPWEPSFLYSIRNLALERGAQFHEARQVGSQGWKSFWETAGLDLMFAVSWRYMIPSSVYARPKLGTFVFHDSLLPSYRGFSPTVWSILNGEECTGATLFEIAEAVDEGDIVDQLRIPIGPDDTVAQVMDYVTSAYLELLERNIDSLLHNSAPRRPQDHSQATYCCKRAPQDNFIDWSWPVSRIFNLIRAVTVPYPGAFTTLGGKRLIIWAAERPQRARSYIGSIPGRVVEFRPGGGATVLAGDRELMLTRVQLEGNEAMPAGDVLNSLNIALGR